MVSPKLNKGYSKLAIKRSFFFDDIDSVVYNDIRYPTLITDFHNDSIETRFKVPLMLMENNSDLVFSKVFYGILYSKFSNVYKKKKIITIEGREIAYSELRFKSKFQQEFEKITGGFERILRNIYG